MEGQGGSNLSKQFRGLNLYHDFRKKYNEDQTDDSDEKQDSVVDSTVE